MLIKYLGTAAAEGMPAVFCRCELCRKARQLGGRDIRTRSQIMIDGDTLIDFPMDSYLHALKYGIDLSAIRDVFITHAHMDHCYPQDFTMHGAPFAHNMTRDIINVYGDAAVIDKFIAGTKDEIKPEVSRTVLLHTLRPYDVISPDERTRVTALPAKHTVGEDCLLYLLSRGGKSVLVMNDTGIVDDEVYERLATDRVRLDLVSFDCTYGSKGKGPGRHMGLPDNLGERDRMSAHGIVGSGTKYVVTHFSHNSAMTHDELSALAESFGMTAAYDGLEIEI